MSEAFDVQVLAKRINRRLQELRDVYPGRRIPITPGMSRILENHPDYIPYRARASTKKRRPATNPSVATVARIAELLETTVGDLLGEPWPLSPREKILFRRTIQAIERLLANSARRVDCDGSSTCERATLTVSSAPTARSSQR